MRVVLCNNDTTTTTTRARSHGRRRRHRCRSARVTRARVQRKHMRAYLCNAQERMHPTTPTPTAAAAAQQQEHAPRVRNVQHTATPLLMSICSSTPLDSSLLAVFCVLFGTWWMAGLDGTPKNI